MVAGIRPATPAGGLAAIRLVRRSAGQRAAGDEPTIDADRGGHRAGRQRCRKPARQHCHRPGRRHAGGGRGESEARQRAPRLVLADEPTGTLDTQTAAEVFRLMHDINREDGVTFPWW